MSRGSHKKEEGHLVVNLCVHSTRPMPQTGQDGIPKASEGGDYVYILSEVISSDVHYNLRNQYFGKKNTDFRLSSASLCVYLVHIN